MTRLVCWKAQAVGLGGWLSWLEHCPIYQKVASLIKAQAIERMECVLNESKIGYRVLKKWLQIMRVIRGCDRIVTQFNFREGQLQGLVTEFFVHRRASSLGFNIAITVGKFLIIFVFEFVFCK